MYFKERKLFKHTNPPGPANIQGKWRGKEQRRGTTEPGQLPPLPCPARGPLCVRGRDGLFWLPVWILHSISSRVTHLSPSWALSMLCCCFRHPHTCGTELLCPAVYGDGHGNERALNGSGDHPFANMQEPRICVPGGGFPPLQMWDLSISALPCTLLFSYLILVEQYKMGSGLQK